jgi:Zn-dependent M28 family amino/carboxypeptidase/uncharacterized protein (DUF1684 family)
VLSHITVLASDDFEGRAPGSRGEERTSEYLIKEFTQLGLKPGAADGSYIQKVPLVGITADGAPLVLKKGATELRLKWKDDVVAWTKHVADTASLKDSELVFVGYGVVAPEYNWDDYKGLDVHGKTIVMLVNDPPVPDPANPAELDPKTFGGKAMTYYGRWTYKYEIAAQKGAAGAIIVHETGPAGYPFEVLQNSNIGEKFDLVTPNKNMDRAAIEAWVTVDRARDILKMAGQNYDELKKLAATREFKPVPLGVTASMTLRNKLRTIDSRNFIARIEGRDPKLKDECVVYTAHWDHLGIGPAVNGDKIYNGAVDNASGVAGLLEIAHAYTKLTTPPKRSILFVAVTAEEQGLLGSEYYAANPVVPLAKTLANINMDGLNVHGRTKDITLVGYGASDLDDYARDAAAEQGRTIRSDPEPEKGFYYRSDHFNFAKLGVPALDPDEGVDFIGKPAGYSQKVRDDYTEHDYHKPSDQVKPDWDLSGAGEDLKLFFAVGYRVAEADTFPAWKPGNEFKAKRDAMLSASAAPAAAPASAGPVDPVKEVTAFRAKHEADYTKEYVPLAGLFFLHAGANTAGSALGAVVQLPKRAPASIGRFTYQNRHVRFEPQPGSPVTLKGKAVTAPIDLKSDDESSDYEELTIGDLAFWLHESGDRRAIRMRDPEGDIATSFAGYHWFPIDEHFRVTGKFIRDAAPHEVKVPSLAGDLETYTTEGVVEFTINGETVRLRPMTTRPNRFFFIFRDGTSGKETYAAARFLYADLQPDGTTVLDFNEAYNPPCSFNPYTTCPFPPKENRLTVRIPVGEKAYAGPHP